MSIYYWRRLRPLSSFLFTAVFPHWGCDCRISKSCVCVQAMQERTRIIPIDITLSIVYKLNRRNHYGLSMMLAGSVIFFLSSVAVSFPSPCPHHINYPWITLLSFLKTKFSLSPLGYIGWHFLNHHELEF